MDLDLLFQQYYFQYRTEADTPNDQDDEFIIFVGLANEAINRWANYDNTFWDELFDTAQSDGSADLTVEANTTQYAAPGNMQEAGGFLRLFDNNNVTQGRIPIVKPNEAQFRSDLSAYCYFVGDPNNGFTLNVNPIATTAQVGLNMDYVYYKQPTLLANANDVSEMPQPYFIVHRALANRFRGSRNPYYQSAKNDAEDVLKTMQMRNNSGSWADPWKLADNSGSTWGQPVGGGFF